MSEPILPTSNLLTKLRNATGHVSETALCADAATEIERLRAEVTEAENEARDANVRADRIAADWTRKRAALTIISTKWSRHVAECQCTLCRIIDVATEALSGDYHE